VVFAGCNSRAPYLATGKGNGTNVFGGNTYVLDADGAQQEKQFGADLLLMSARAASWPPSDSWVAVSQMTTNPGRRE
jgi:hypothetical protein